ncbi:MAG: hypothetical protein ALECFALPRED_008575 [Alectoria fallacina]|uniref:Uncharacterized protein n=1 Tax=Alectoria fallacina TaxID=1903189 RepID=A0A8H3I292_9LECA|nr:MAG: hypothetical protein ALECFALPRED_008575 [Alectoria fallacina]
MVKETTFSLIVSTKIYARGFWILRSTIATIIKALPEEACVNVEVDTKDYDEPAPRPVHLCDDLRAILPRLQLLRLCLAMMCPAVFMSGYSAFEPNEFRSQLKPVVAPFLKTLIESCLLGSILATGQAGLCDPGCTPDQTPGLRDYINDSEELATTIVNAICLIKDTISFPVAERIRICGFLLCL